MTGLTQARAPLLYSSLGADPDLGELVELFVAEMPERVATFRGLFARQQWEELRRAAHQLKGAAGGYGFSQISPCAARLENAIRQRLSEEQIRQAVEELTDLCHRARSGSPD